MHDYYSKKLSAERLRLCYEIAPPRVQRYFEAETRYVAKKTRAGDRLLELGCGYGRVFEPLAANGAAVTGIDTSLESLLLARKIAGGCNVAQMDAASLGFGDGSFDVVACIQNGISAFGVDRRGLLLEAVRVTRRGGTVLFSSYSERFWADRLEWFRLQSERGLLGEIDEQATGDGVIVCRDGFRAATVGPEEFRRLLPEFAGTLRIREVDGSSLFCEITVE